MTDCCGETRIINTGGGGGVSGLLETSPGHLGPATATETDVSGLRDTGQTAQRVEVIGDTVDFTPDGAVVTARFDDTGTFIDHTEADPDDGTVVQRSFFNDVDAVFGGLGETPSPRTALVLRSNPAGEPEVVGVFQVRRVTPLDGQNNRVEWASSVVRGDFGLFATSTAFLEEGVTGECYQAWEVQEPPTGRSVRIQQEVAPGSGNDIYQRYLVEDPSFGQLFRITEIQPTLSQEAATFSRAGLEQAQHEVVLTDGIGTTNVISVGAGRLASVETAHDTITGFYSSRIKAGPGVGTDRAITITESAGEPEIQALLGDALANTNINVVPPSGQAFRLVIVDDGAGNPVIRYDPTPYTL